MAFLFVGYFKKLVSETSYAPALQSLALVLFVLFFIGACFVVFKRPKEYYDEASKLPLEEE